ncbi:iron complex transport system permease protein [Desulfacinum hydrothermale DSM 13146]|uniref:Iron complex transport system permease protein n=1 Tax=Desulfacinum hydrothermale DSM 13146 TaxID=1121390 RepID=A0A1W1WXH4_9BACT|nr:iron ABC transporter permease [Desulfacinum hydrothermale]SMC16422.1 iron complex transport system permease protein [Desulfacinum hydrothermale DSM 13146]
MSRPRRPVPHRLFLFWTVVGLLVPACALLCTAVGPFHLEASQVLRILSHPYHSGPTTEAEQTARYIVLNVRLARAVLALLVGAALALAGAVYQGVLLNPLADPFTLGVSSGAAFGASLAILGGWGAWNLAGLGTLPVAAFAGAAGALLLVLLLGRMDGRVQTATLVLAGIIVSTFLSAWISLLKSLNEDSLSTIVFWIMGSLSGRSWQHVLIILPYLVGGVCVIFFYVRELDLLALGDVSAHQMGVDVSQVRLRLLAAASLITAAAVAVSGVIGFVGLVVPHLVRLLLGPRHGRLLPAVLATGALLTLLSDTLARSILPGGQEIPLGVVTAILGAPFFCYLLLSKRKAVLA